MTCECCGYGDLSSAHRNRRQQQYRDEPQSNRVGVLSAECCSVGRKLAQRTGFAPKPIYNIHTYIHTILARLAENAIYMLY